MGAHTSPIANAVPTRKGLAGSPRAIGVLIYRPDFLTAIFLGDVAFFLVAEAFFRFLDAPTGVATPVLTASFPSAVPIASAAVFRNGVG